METQAIENGDPKDWTDPSVFEHYDDFRNIYRDLTKEIVQKVVSENFSNIEAPIVEIGSGAGEFSRLVSEDIRERLIQTEKSEQFAGLHKDERGNVIRADIYSMPFKDSSVSAVAGFAMFDTLYDSDLAAREISRILKPEGKFIHFLDLEPNIDVLFSDIEKKERIPVFRGRSNRDYEEVGQRIENWLSYAAFSTADRADFARSIESLKAKANPLAEVAEEYLADPLNTYKKYAGIGSESIITMMASQLKKDGLILPPFNMEEYFRRKLGDVFQKNGFTIQMNELLSAESLIEKDDPRVAGFEHPNILINRMGNMLGTEMPGIPEGKMKLQEYIHVFVAQKAS